MVDLILLGFIVGLLGSFGVVIGATIVQEILFVCEELVQFCKDTWGK